MNPASLLLPHRQHAGALPCRLFCNFRDVSDFLESKTSWLTDGHLFWGLGTGPGSRPWLGRIRCGGTSESHRQLSAWGCPVPPPPCSSSV